MRLLSLLGHGMQKATECLISEKRSVLYADFLLQLTKQKWKRFLEPVEVIKKLRKLILAGETVVGPPPGKAVGLKNYPESDEQLRKIAEGIWGDLDGKIRTERKFGQGRVIWGKTPREILLAEDVTPDFTFSGQAESPEQFDYIHRKQGDDDIYFVINRTNQPEKRDFTFRVTGKQPEIWNAVTGEMYKADAYKQMEIGKRCIEMKGYFLILES